MTLLVWLNTFAAEENMLTDQQATLVLFFMRNSIIVTLFCGIHRIKISIYVMLCPNPMAV